MEAEKCAICEAEFKTGHLVEGTCEVCKKLWPGAKRKEDRNKIKKPEVANQEAIIKELITKQVDDILEKYDILQKCDCGNLYYKRSPAQKGCGCQKETK